MTDGGGEDRAFDRGPGAPRLADEARARRIDRCRRLDRESYDAVVVGAGVSGLVCASLLADQGLSVLVADRHHVAGGNTTSFRRPGYRFDVGLHYIGDCGPGGAIPTLLARAGVADIEFLDLEPDGYDILLFPGGEFRVPRGLAAYHARLAAAFPQEARGIAAYVALLSDVDANLRAAGGGPSDPASVARLARHSRATLGGFLDTCTADPLLRAVLAGQHLLHATPPSRGSLLGHASVVTHLLRGACYPRGGGQRIADRLVSAVERRGGRFLLRADVVGIDVADGRVRGVRLSSAHLGRRTIATRSVVAAGDLKRSLLHLLEPKHLSSRTAGLVEDYEMAPGLGIVYLGLRRDLLAQGVPNANYFIHPTLDAEDAYSAVRAGAFPAAPPCYISLGALRDPLDTTQAPPGIATIQVMGVAPSAPEAWRTTPGAVASGRYRRERDYRRAKDDFAHALLRVAERALPGLQGEVVYREVATPLTHQRITASTGGAAYGIALTAAQALHRRLGPETEVQGLYLCGASTRAGHGIHGALVSGAQAASCLLAHRAG